MGYIFENCHGDTVCNQQHGDIYIYAFSQHVME
jgi:hypothetical protein